LEWRGHQAVNLCRFWNGMELWSDFRPRRLADFAPDPHHEKDRHLNLQMLVMFTLKK
jgi:hypothetical protein